MKTHFHKHTYSVRENNNADLYRNADLKIFITLIFLLFCISAVLSAAITCNVVAKKLGSRLEKNEVIVG